MDLNKLNSIRDNVIAEETQLQGEQIEIINSLKSICNDLIVEEEKLITAIHYISDDELQEILNYLVKRDYNANNYKLNFQIIVPIIEISFENGHHLTINDKNSYSFQIYDNICHNFLYESLFKINIKTNDYNVITDKFINIMINKMDSYLEDNNFLKYKIGKGYKGTGFIMPNINDSILLDNIQKALLNRLQLFGYEIVGIKKSINSPFINFNIYVKNPLT